MNEEKRLDYIDDLNTPLVKLELDVSPKFDTFFQVIKKIRHKNLLYLRVLSQHYIHIQRLVEKQKEFNNFIITIENEKLSEEELIEMYRFVNEPIDVGMTLSNVKNF